MSYVLVRQAGIVDVRTWQIQDAKSQLSEVIETAQGDGPQFITRHGRPRAVLLSFADYEALTSHKPDFKHWLLGGPKIDLAVSEPVQLSGELEG